MNNTFYHESWKPLFDKFETTSSINLDALYSDESTLEKENVYRVFEM